MRRTTYRAVRNSEKKKGTELERVILQRFCNCETLSAASTKGYMGSI
jgi:hypothetical protein